jgi:tape measure domain-containing protein
MSDNLKVGLEIRTSTPGAEQVQGLENSVRELGQASNKAAPEQAKQADASRKQGESASGAESAINRLRNAIEGLAVAKLTSDFVRLSAEQEANRKALDQLAGSAQAGGAEMDYLRAAANRLGVNLGDATKAYISLTAATKGTALEGQNTRAIFESVVGAMSKLGKSSAETQNALIAVSQMASKGTVSMEELRGQLGEALPGAMQAAARAMGVTVAELDKMVSSGSVTAEQLLPRLAEELNKTFGSAPPDTLNASMAQLENRVTAAVGAMTEAGTTSTVIKGALTALSGITAALADIFNSAAEAVGVFGKGLAATFLSLQKVFQGDFKGAIDSWKANMAEAMDTAANNINKVRGAVGLLPEDAKAAQQNTQPALGAMTTDAEKLAAAFTGAGNAATGMAGATGAAAEKLAKQFKLDTLEGVLNLGDAFLLSGKNAEELAVKLNAAKGVIEKMDDATLSSFTEHLNTAFSTGQIGAKEFAELNNTALSQSFTRLGLDIDEAFGGISKQGGAAINNIDTMITSLKAAGITGKEAGGAIEAALSAAINKAKTTADIEAIRARIASLRQQLGDKVADGLLQQVEEQLNKIKDRADKAKAGINSAREAYEKLGIKSDEALKKEAQSNLEAARYIEQHGGSVREVTEAWKKYLESALAANGGVADELMQVQAEMHGLEIATDNAGKAFVRVKGAADDAGKAGANAGQQSAGAMQTAADATEQYISALERAQQQAERLDAIERKRKGVDKDGFVADKDGNRIVAGSQVNSRLGIINYLKSAGMDEATATRMSQLLLDGGGKPVWNNFGFDSTRLASQLGVSGDFGPYGPTPEQILNALVTKYLDQKAGSSAAAGSSPSSQTHVVKLQLPGGGSRDVQVNSERDVQALLDALKSAGLTARPA